MFTTQMTVAQRVVALKAIFYDFGVTVADNSILDQTIRAEFGPGKRSKLTKLLLELHKETDASVLAKCIGVELGSDTSDPELLAVSRVLQQQLPHLLCILDLRQQSIKREVLLTQLLDHFVAKLTPDPRADRLLRMLNAASQRLQAKVQMCALGHAVEHLGAAFNVTDLQRCGRILQGITPALIALDDPEVLLSLKINYCVRALRVLASELYLTNLQTAANIIEHVHWLANISLPAVSDQATIEQALRNLDVSLGTIASLKLQSKARELGLTEKEITQVFYANTTLVKFTPEDQELLKQTQTNQQAAAFCGYLAKLGQEIQHEDLEKIGVSGMCLVALRQTFFELKTGNITAAGFSESLGLILSGVGTITQNQKIKYIGDSISAGVKTYAGLMAVPGGAALAIPLAVCTVVGKYLLDSRSAAKHKAAPDPLMFLHKLIEQIVVVQQMLRQHFAHLYAQLQEMYSNLIMALDQGFANLTYLVQTQHLETIDAINSLRQKIDNLQAHMDQEFSGLYMEYIRAPIEEIDYAIKYGWLDPEKMHKHKHKLAMWLLYKAKHNKVNGAGLLTNHQDQEDLPSYFMLVFNNINNFDAAICMINRYVNLQFGAGLPEDLPHVPTWLLAAQLYVMLTLQYNIAKAVTNEAQIVTDVLAVGLQISTYIEALAANQRLWRQLTEAVIAQEVVIQTKIIALQNADNCWWSLANMLTHQTSAAQILAQSAADLQMEPFTQINVDITAHWHKHIGSAIPKEFKLASELGLGALTITFCLDHTVNHFAEVHIPCSDQLLPAHARVVLFRIDVHFKLALTDQQPYLLSSSWFGHDLHTARRRFAEYYMLKFKYGLRHGNYHWISLDGRVNQVGGHGDTPTQKLIDYDRLARIYQGWLTQAVPVNHETVLNLVRQNPSFVAQHGAMLDRNEFAKVCHTQIEMLRLIVQAQLRELLIKRRLQCAGVLQQDKQCMRAIEKADAYHTVLTVFARLTNVNFSHVRLGDKLKDLLAMLQDPAAIDKSLMRPLLRFTKLKPIDLSFETRFAQGEFYGKIQHALAALRILRASLEGSVALADAPALAVARPV